MATPLLSAQTCSGKLGPVEIDIWSDRNPTPGPAVIIVHGFKGFKDWGFFPKIAERLARAGFSVVNLTLSGAGFDRVGEFAYPERFGHNTFSAEIFDLRIVLDLLDNGKLAIPRPTSVGLLGHSRGGGVAILFAASHSRISALVTWAGISTTMRWDEATRARWRQEGSISIINSRTGVATPLYTDILDDLDAHPASLDIAAAAKRLAIPWLIAHGENDETVPIEEGKRLADYNTQAAQLWIPQTGHTFGVTHPWAGPTSAAARLFDETVAHFSRHLK